MFSGKNCGQSSQCFTSTTGGIGEVEHFEAKKLNQLAKCFANSVKYWHAQLHRYFAIGSLTSATLHETIFTGKLIMTQTTEVYAQKTSC